MFLGEPNELLQEQETVKAVTYNNKVVTKDSSNKDHLTKLLNEHGALSRELSLANYDYETTKKSIQETQKSHSLERQNHLLGNRGEEHLHHQSAINEERQLFAEELNAQTHTITQKIDGIRYRLAENSMLQKLVIIGKIIKEEDIYTDFVIIGKPELASKNSDIQAGCYKATVFEDYHKKHSYATAPIADLKRKTFVERSLPKCDIKVNITEFENNADFFRWGVRLLPGQIFLAKKPSPQFSIKEREIQTMNENAALLQQVHTFKALDRIFRESVTRFFSISRTEGMERLWREGEEIISLCETHNTKLCTDTFKELNNELRGQFDANQDWWNKIGCGHVPLKKHCDGDNAVMHIRRTRLANSIIRIG